MSIEFNQDVWSDSKTGFYFHSEIGRGDIFEFEIEQYTEYSGYHVYFTLFDILDMTD